MRALIVFVALLAVLAVGLWIAGAFDPAESPPEEPSTPGTTDGDGDADPDTDGTPNIGTAAGAPGDRPPLEWNRFPDGTRALFIGRTRNPENEFMLQVLAKPEQVSYQSWYLNAGGEVAQGAAKGMPALESMPTQDHLAELDIDLLILDNVTPEDLPDEFWEAVQERVTTGKTGLLYRVYWPLSGYEGDVTVHPALSHPILKTLLPVTDAAPLEGQDDGSGRSRVPGLFTTEQPFVVTDAGAEHIATRLVSWPEWSHDYWTSFREGAINPEAGMWTKFCYPVTGVAEGAKVLVGVEAREGDPIPAVIVTPEADGRVAWLGVPQFGWRYHYNPKDREQVAVVIHNLLAWIAGA